MTQYDYKVALLMPMIYKHPTCDSFLSLLV